MSHHVLFFDVPCPYKLNPTKLHLRAVGLRIAELERAVGTFRTEKSPKKSSADGDEDLVNLLLEKWAKPAAER